MTGPEHYQEAEKTLTQAWDSDPERRTALIQDAQVHATLALAAAVGTLTDAGEEFGRHPGDGEDWLRATGARKR